MSESTIPAIKYSVKVVTDFIHNSWTTISEVFIPSKSLGFNRGENGNTICVFKMDEPRYLRSMRYTEFTEEALNDPSCLDIIRKEREREEKEKKDRLENANPENIHLPASFVDELEKYITLQAALLIKVTDHL